MLLTDWIQRATRGGVQVVFADDGIDAPAGAGMAPEAVIRINAARTPAEQVCTLVYELVRLERGGPVSAAELLEVEAEAARRLISCEALTAAAAVARDERELAERLGVDEATLRARQRVLAFRPRLELVTAASA